MANNSRTNICISLLLSFLMMAFCGCDKDTDAFDVHYFSVSGVVKSEDVPVPGIIVTMTAYSVEDIDKTAPLYFESCLSSFAGEYQFSLLSDDNLSEMFFVFRLYEDYTLMAAQPLFERELFLSRNPFYNDFMKSYEVKGNDFNLFYKKQ